METFMGGTPDGRSVIVVGVDFSETSQRAISVARELVKFLPNAEVHLIHVTTPIASPFALGESVNESVGIATEQVERVSAKFAKVCQETAADLRARVVGHLRTGVPHRGITQLASDVGADLVLVGTQGRRGLERFILGSVAERVLRYAPCPVLVVRPKDQPVWPKIEPPCPDCLAVQRRGEPGHLWCERHSQHHPQAHTYYKYPEPYGVGALTFR